MAEPILTAAALAGLAAAATEPGRKAVKTTAKAGGRAAGHATRATGRGVATGSRLAGTKTSQAAHTRWRGREHAPIPLLWRQLPTTATPSGGPGPERPLENSPGLAAGGSFVGAAGGPGESRDPARSKASTRSAPGPVSSPPIDTPAGVEGSTTTVSRSSRRFAINLEPPTNDAEFLASCVDLADVLRSLSDEIEQWAQGLSGMGLPSSVTTPLNSVAEGLTEAAGGASRAAQMFADEFEDARDIAARGMKFTGREAA